MRLPFSTTLLALTITLVAACTPSTSTEVEAANALATEVTAEALNGAKVLAEGTFSGRNDHVVTGRVQIVDHGGEAFLRLDKAFTLDGAPDPKIGFGRTGSYDTSTTFTPLAAMTGAQDYALPAGFQLGSLDEAYIWCEEFSVALGVAEFKP